jgi:hypothetical protein
MIAGNAAARSPQERGRVSFGCTGAFLLRPRQGVPLCGVRSELRMHIAFPDCWDGRRRDSADHKSHMAYSARRTCPASHPVAVPTLSFNVIYPTRGVPGLALSSGPWWTAHADFFNAWQPGVQEALVRRCLNGAQHCERD